VIAAAPRCHADLVVLEINQGHNNMSEREILARYSPPIGASACRIAGAQRRSMSFITATVAVTS